MIMSFYYPAQKSPAENGIPKKFLDRSLPLEMKWLKTNQFLFKSLQTTVTECQTRQLLWIKKVISDH